MKTNNDQSTCPSPETVVNMIMDPAATGHEPSFLDHITACKACQQLVAETTETCRQLKQDPDQPAPDLTSAIMAQLPTDAWQAPATIAANDRLLRWRYPLAVAATLAFLLGATYFLPSIGNRQHVGQRLDSPLTLAIDAGERWLLDNQRPSGEWDVTQLGGREEYSEALNGLTLMAIINAEKEHEAHTLAALERGARHLLVQQSAEGLISHTDNAAMYNHGMATLALLEVNRLTRNDNLNAPIDKAIATICRYQSPTGGWGYRADTAAAPNTSISVWQIKALLQARAQGYDVPIPVLTRSLNWLAGTASPQGAFGYSGPHRHNNAPTDMSVMGASCLLAARDADLMNDPRLADVIKQNIRQLASNPPSDYHQAYFLASVLTHADPTPEGTDIATIRQHLLARQIRSGQEAGCWNIAGDRWGKTGGKLYSTAMAMLVLSEPQSR